MLLLCYYIITRLVWVVISFLSYQSKNNFQHGLILSRFKTLYLRKSGNIPPGTLTKLDKEVALINRDKIDEWIREVEERPASAALIIQYIANRLSELAAREEELAAQNIELLSGRKVEEYENRIASLEYQLELLKRQLGGEVILPNRSTDA